MRAVWSLWSSPLRRESSPWLHERGHWLSWILSVETARRHYAEVALVADSAAAHILTEELGLSFNHVSTELDALAGVDPHWWAIGKLYAYRAQREPFVHIDADVFLWKRLPAIVEYAPILAQSPEAVFDNSLYQPERLAQRFEAKMGAVPEPWRWYLARGYQTAACCGIMGANDIECVQAYTELALNIALDPRHQAIWEGEDLQQHMLFIEQYLLNATVEYRRAHRTGGNDVRIQYLFPSGSFERAEEAGYTHLIAGAKRNAALLDRLEEVVRRDYPLHYRRCLDFLARRTSKSASQLVSAAPLGS
jgi:hypothetical protein